MLGVETKFSERWKNCDVCEKNIPPREYFCQVSSDVDPGKLATMCIECFATCSAPFQAERVMEMVAKHFPNEARAQRAYEQILNKVSKRKKG